jgi:hypothetical protein
MQRVNLIGVGNPAAVGHVAAVEHVRQDGERVLRRLQVAGDDECPQHQVVVEVAA